MDHRPSHAQVSQFPRASRGLTTMSITVATLLLSGILVSAAPASSTTSSSFTDTSALGSADVTVGDSPNEYDDGGTSVLARRLSDIAGNTDTADQKHNVPSISDLLRRATSGGHAVIDAETPWAFQHVVSPDPLLSVNGGPSAPGVGIGGGTEGWLAHWLSMGGEGTVTVMLGDGDDAVNITMPHRPAAFPSFVYHPVQLPVTGTLVPFTTLPERGKPKGATNILNQPTVSPSVRSHLLERLTLPTRLLERSIRSRKQPATVISTAGPQPPERACIPSQWRSMPDPVEPFTIALIERGGCDFATKVQAAQARGAQAVVVGDSAAYQGEPDEEGRQRHNLITMYSPEDTSRILIPSVFVSRASYLTLRDLLQNHSIDGRPGLHVEVGDADDDGNALGSLLTFALLMPSLFLLATVAAHRVRVARQREANRASPTVVLSLRERVWTPDIAWEKDDSDESGNEADVEAGEANTDETPKPTDGDMSDSNGTPVKPASARPKRKKRRQSKRYYSKDECAICMESFQRGEVVRILPCGHVFHKAECDEWLLKWRKLCPTCRADVTIPSGDLSESTTLTPVVEANAAPSGTGATGYGAVQPTTDPVEGPSWISVAGAQVTTSLRRAFQTVRTTLRRGGAVVRNSPLPSRSTPNATASQNSESTNERTPLVGADTV